MSRNKNFTLNLLGSDTETSLPQSQVVSLMKVMNMMDKNGYTEEETRRIVIEELLSYNHKIEEDNLKPQAGDARPSSPRALKELSTAATNSIKKRLSPDPSSSLIVSKKSTIGQQKLNTLRLTMKDVEVQKGVEIPKYPIYVSENDIVTIYPSYLIDNFMNRPRKKEKPNEYSLGWLIYFLLAAGIITAAYSLNPVRTRVLSQLQAIEG